MKKKTLLVVAKFVDGGTGVFVDNLLKLQERYRDDFKVHAVVLQKPRFRKSGLPGEYTFHRNAPYPSRYFLLSRFGLSFVGELFWFRNIANTYAPDIVISVDLHAGLVAELVRAGGMPYRHVATIHNNVDASLREKASTPLRPVLHAAFGWVLRRADAVTCVASDLAAAVRREYRLRVRPVTIHSGESFGKAGRTPRPDKNTKVVLSVGRLAPQKDPLTLIRAFAEVIKKEPGAHLWIVGDGEMRDAVKAALRELPRGASTFWGWRQDPVTFMRRAGVFALSSVREGFPYVLLEAFSCGLPVVTTDAPYGPSELLGKGKYGRLVAVGDYQGMAEAILSVLRKPPGAAFRNRLIARSAKYSLPSVLRLYRDLLIGV